MVNLVLEVLLSIEVLAIVILFLYERRVIKMRRLFLKYTLPSEFADLIRLSLNSAMSMLSFSGVILSLWAGFGLIAPQMIKELYSGEILAVIVACSVATLSYAITVFIYHLARYMQFKKGETKEESKIRTELFIKGETFFMLGTVFFLLVFLFSLIIMPFILMPTFTQSFSIILLGFVPLIIVGLVAFRHLKPVFQRLQKMKKA